MGKRIKQIIYLILLLVVAACEVIPESERIVEVEIAPAKKRVLLQEFTGWQCVNCPQAAEIAHSLKATYGDNFVVVALHPYNHNFTDPGAKGPDFRTQEATDYLTFAGGGTTTGFPTGTIDITEFNGSYLQDRDAWTTYVSQQLTLNTSVDLVVTSTADTTTHQLQIVTEVQATDDNENINLVLWLTENKVIAVQATQSGYNTNYEHNHILRAALNGTWGEKLPDLLKGETKTVITSYTANKAWNLNNCTVIAAVINADTKRVLNVWEINVIAAQN